VYKKQKVEKENILNLSNNNVHNDQTPGKDHKSNDNILL
jgi:hypothetical protein